MRYHITSILIYCCCILASAQSIAARTDIVYLNNGDRITGEVKGVSSGQLEIKTDDLGVIFINWEAIRDLVSDNKHQVQLSDGSLVSGKLSKPKASGEAVVEGEELDSLIGVETNSGIVDLNSDEIVVMYPLGATFWDRVDIDLSLGYNFDKSSSVGKSNIAMGARYRGQEYMNLGKFTSEFTTQNDIDTTSRNILSLAHIANLPNKRYYSYFGNLEQNDQLGIDLRTVIGADYGWVPISTNAHWLTMGAGVAVNLERPFDDTDPDQNLEAVGTIRYQHYKQSIPKRNIEAYFRIMPSLTQWDRIRTDFTLDFKWEIVESLFFGTDFYASHDSKPPSPEASDTDYGIRTSVGYSF
jgi:hypothetical protein